MNILLAALLAAVALPANAGMAAAERPAIHTVTRLGSSAMTLTCGTGSSQACHYLILTSLCQERYLNDGSKERTCNHMEAAPPFHIKPGGTKTVANLPSDFICTMKSGGAPTASQCLNAPIAH